MAKLRIQSSKWLVRHRGKMRIQSSKWLVRHRGKIENTKF